MSKSTSANIGFEEKLWLAADKMRNNMDPSEYKNVILGLIFLKYITDTFEATKKNIIAESDYYQGLEEDKDAYLAHNAFFVPKEARWQFIMDNAQKPEIGIIIDNAMDAIMKDNHSLRGSLPKTYARSELDKTRLGEIVNLISSIDLTEEAKSKKDILGRIYEYFLGRFASSEGKGGGEFFTPQCVVKLLALMLEPYSGRVYEIKTRYLIQRYAA